MVAFICSESVIPAIPDSKERQGSLLHSLQPSDIFRCIWRRTQLHQVSYQRRYGNIHSRAYSGHVLRFLHVTGMVAMI